MAKLFGFVPGKADISHVIYDKLINDLEVKIDDKGVGEILRKIEGASSEEKKKILDDLLEKPKPKPKPKKEEKFDKKFDKSGRIKAIYIDAIGIFQQKNNDVERLGQSGPDEKSENPYNRTPVKGHNQFFEQLATETHFVQKKMDTEAIMKSIAVQWIKEKRTECNVTETELLKTLEKFESCKISSYLQ